MAMALRPRAEGSHGLDDQLAVANGLDDQALARGARLGRSPDTGAASPVPVPADGAREESVDTSDEMAGFAGRAEGRPRPRTTTPAAFR